MPRTKLTVSLLLLALFLYMLSRFKVVIPPFILAVILSYVLTPIVNRLEARLPLPRGAVTLIVYVLVIVVLALIPIVFVPPLAEQIAGLNVDIQLLAQQVQKLIGHRYVLLTGQVIDGAAVFDHLVKVIQDIVKPLVEQSVSFALDVLSSLAWVIFVFVVSFYLVKDHQAVVAWLDRLPPPDYREDFRRLRSELNQIWSAFFRGQLILGLVVATLFTVFGFIIGLPFALAMGVLAGLMEFLPSIGHGIWLSIATILALFGGSSWINLPNWLFEMILIGLHIIFQQFDLNYLIPRIIGRQVHLSPLVVILSIVAGAAVAGVLGVMLAAPTVASARVLLRYIFANLMDEDPFPETDSQPTLSPDPRWWVRKTQ